MKVSMLRDEETIGPLWLPKFGTGRIKPTRPGVSEHGADRVYVPSTDELQ